MNIRPAPLLSWFAVWLNGLISAASAQAVAFADLAGTTISYTLVFDQVVLREGREIPVQVEQNIKLIIGPGDTIHSTAVNTSHNPYGTRQGEPGSRPPNWPRRKNCKPWVAVMASGLSSMEH